MRGVDRKGLDGGSVQPIREKQIPRYARDDGRVRIKQLLAVAFAAVMAAGLAGFASMANAQQLEEKSTDRKTFSGARELIIDNITGFIEVTAGTGSTVEVEIEKSLKAR